MYQGNSKENGGIIGDLTTGEGNGGVFMDEASESTSAEESLICQDDEGNEYSLTASLASSGEIIWSQRLSKEQILRRTVAMSQMTSMMRDNDRNALYEAAIEVCIKNFIRQYNRAPIVLDIGSGTGLLSMLCLKHGAQFVFGVEMFDEMSRIGQEVVNANNSEDNILIINAKSTDIDALPMPADIIVSEILDSALLGECCIPSHLDAIRRLMSNNETDVVNRIIPNSAQVFGTLLESAEVLHMHDISAIPLGNETSQPTDARISEDQNGYSSFHGFDPYRNFYASDCTGGWPLIPIHYNELLARGARPLSDSVPVMSVDFYRSAFNSPTSGSSSMEAEDGGESEQQQQQQEVTYDTDILVTSEGTVHGVALWWKVHLLPSSLDPHQQCSYSTQAGAQNWQDHWQQTVFPLAKSFVAKVGDVVRVSVARNNIRMWLNAVLLTSDEVECSSKSADLLSPLSTVSAYEGTEIEELDENDSYQVVSSRKRIKRDTSSPTTLSHARYHQSHTRISSNRLAPSECGCGWHLLCGADRIQMMNDPYRGSMWDAALVSMLAKLYDLGLLNSYPITSSSNADEVTAKTHNVILDVSDGSMLAISTALKLHQHNAKLAVTHKDNSTSFVASSSKLNAKVVSKESKFFSKLFFSQLVGVNDLDDYLMVWDGMSFEDISTYWDENEDQDDGYDEEDDMDEEGDEGGEKDDDQASMDGNVDSGDSVNIKTATFETAPSSPQHDYAQAMSATEVVAHSSTAQIIALISECYNYQLTALPVWQALSFHYQRSALQLSLHSSAIIMPQRAFVMAAAFESSQLRQCHGTAGVVCGFDHSPLDARQNDWFTYSYPYRMANYQKRMLCQPIVVATLDYTHMITGQPQSFLCTDFDTSGRCDLVAIWVDYQLTEDPTSLLKCWNSGNFPPHMKVTLKYFQQSQMVQAGASKLQCRCAEFAVGDSDFNFDFFVVA